MTEVPEESKIAKESTESSAPRLCQVKLRNAGKRYTYDAHRLSLTVKQRVVIEHDHALYAGTVVATQEPSEDIRDNQDSNKKHQKIVRLFTEADEQQQKEALRLEKEATQATLKLVHARRIPMKIVATEMSLSLDKLTIYFASEERIDFRGLIRELAQQFRARVDMRQIGARDSAKLIGGIGSCGLALCCSTWLVEFRPVSIKMAKDQNLALNPEKVSGACGRLLCCLTYEQDTYATLRQGLPKIGKRVYTPLGEGRVKDVNVLRGKIRVQMTDGYEEFDASQVKPMFGSKGELLEPLKTPS